MKENFEEWKSPVFTERNPYDRESKEFLNWPEKYHDHSHLDSTFYTNEELGRYSSVLSKFFASERVSGRKMDGPTAIWE